MRLIAYFTASERRALRWSGGRLHAERAFAADEAGLAAWREYLATRRGGRMTIVVDLPGEAFHEERIPRLRGGDRAAVVERRLAQRFPQARLAAVLPLGPPDGGRREETLLLASWANARALDAWLDALPQAGVRLAGVTSTAWLTAALLGPGTGRASHAFVLGVHGDGLRECVLQGGRLRFARFERCATQATQDDALRAQGEIGRLLAYLVARGTLPADGPALPVFVVAREAQRTAFERVLAPDLRFALRFVALEALARRAGLRETLPELGAEQLSLALAARRPLGAQFARPADRRDFVQWQWRRALLAAGTLAFACGTAVAGLQFRQATVLRDEARVQRRAARAAAPRRPANAAAQPAPSTRPENMRLAVDEMRRIAAGAPAPEAALAHLSRALDQCPDIALETLAWRVPPAAAAPGSTAPPAQTLEITAHVASRAPSGVRALSAEVARFAAALQARGEWQVVRTRLPFDLTPQATLRGGDGAGSPAPRFVIVVARPLG